jgi:hypothetical protein
MLEWVMVKFSLIFYQKYAIAVINPKNGIEAIVNFEN